MKIEKLVFDCTNAIGELKVVTINLRESKVELEGKQEVMGNDVQRLVKTYVLYLSEVIMQNNAERGQYQQVLTQLAFAIVCSIIQIQFCDWMIIDKVTPKVVMNIENIEI